jgi:hypothetical protein
MTSDEYFGKLAYEAYGESTGGVSAVSGARLPAWDQQAEPLRKAWIEAADAVRGKPCGCQNRDGTAPECGPTKDKLGRMCACGHLVSSEL